MKQRKKSKLNYKVVKWYVATSLIPFVIISITLIFNSGCSRYFVTHRCPTFDLGIKIKLKEINQTHYAISKEDAMKLKAFAKAKEEYNKRIKILNKEIMP